MNDLITVNFDTQTVSARELHKALEISSRFSRWFDTNKELFVEGEDYNKCTSSTVVNNGAVRELEDYQISVLMAKHLSMMSRTEKGKTIRNYLIDLEKAWNTPEQVMARALRLADKTIDSLKDRCKFLGGQVEEQQRVIEELQPKASYYDMILQCKDLIATTVIAKDYGMSAKKFNALLHDSGIQFKSGDVWVLYAKYQGNGYLKTKTHNFADEDGIQHSKEHSYWTQKGRLFLYEKLKSSGIYPLIERNEVMA